MKIELNPPMTLSKIASVCGGRLTVGDASISSIATHSDEASAGSLFLGFEGKEKDGAAYFPAAIAKGAHTLGTHDASVLVRDTETALLALAAERRKHLSELKHTIAVTGSVGKTTTRKMLGFLLQQKYIIHETEGNFNSTVGMPLTVLAAPADTEVLLCECGMNHAGELSLLSKCLSPDLAIITNVGTAHIGNLGSREAIAKAKCEIRDGLDPRDHLLYPYGEPLLSGIGGYTVGFLPGADFAFEIGENVLRFSRKTQNVCFPLPFRDDASLSCLSFAIAAACLLGLDCDGLRERIALMDETFLRRKIYRCNDHLILDDSYNSSPESLAAALRDLSDHHAQRFALLGDMLELGDYACALHEEAGKICGASGLTKLFLYGEMAESYRKGAIAGGMKDRNIVILPHSTPLQESARLILAALTSGSMLLCKGSHASGISEIISELIKE